MSLTDFLTVCMIIQISRRLLPYHYLYYKTIRNLEYLEGKKSYYYKHITKHYVGQYINANT